MKIADIIFSYFMVTGRKLICLILLKKYCILHWINIIVVSNVSETEGKNILYLLILLFWCFLKYKVIKPGREIW